MHGGQWTHPYLWFHPGHTPESTQGASRPLAARTDRNNQEPYAKAKKPMSPASGHCRPGHINSNTKVIKRPISAAYVIWYGNAQPGKRYRFLNCGHKMKPRSCEQHEHHWPCEARKNRSKEIATNDALCSLRSVLFAISALCNQCSLQSVLFAIATLCCQCSLQSVLLAVNALGSQCSLPCSLRRVLIAKSAHCEVCELDRVCGLLPSVWTWP